MLSTEQIEIFFYNYEEIRLAVADKRGGETVERVGISYTLSNPTEINAIKNMTEINYVVIEDKKLLERKIYRPERVLTLVEEVWKNYSGEKKEILHLKYDKEESRREICEKLGISFKKYNAILNEVFAFAKGIGAILKV